jgi:tRNA(Ile2) C34 agmatinyltransferase TiaS
MKAKHDEKRKICPYCHYAGWLYVSWAGRNYFRCDVCDLIFRDIQGDHVRETSIDIIRTVISTSMRD